MAATIALLDDKRVVSSSWQQVLGLHMSREEAKSSLPECRTGEKQRQKERKQNGRLEKKQQQTTKPNGWLSVSVGIYCSLKHLEYAFPEAAHHGAGLGPQGARPQESSSPLSPGVQLSTTLQGDRDMSLESLWPPSEKGTRWHGQMCTAPLAAV